MGKFKDEGDPAIALIEEMSEAIKVISKKIRFQRKWNQCRPGKFETCGMELQAEMDDVLYQWNRLQEQIEQDTEIY